MRWLLFVFYLLSGPLYFLTQFSSQDASWYLAAAALLPGLLVGRLHLRQTTGKARVGVALGTLCGIGAGLAAWAMGLLALAFAGDSGQHARLLQNLAIAWTFGVLVAAPPLGALLVLSALKALGSSKR